MVAYYIIKDLKGKEHKFSAYEEVKEILRLDENHYFPLLTISIGKEHADLISNDVRIGGVETAPVLLELNVKL